MHVAICEKVHTKTIHEGIFRKKVDGTDTVTRSVMIGEHRLVRIIRDCSTYP